MPNDAKRVDSRDDPRALDLADDGPRVVVGAARPV